MTTTTRVWVLGAPDPEMEAIERLLTEVGETVHHATADGRRVHPGSAYRADAVQGATHWVECAPIGGHPDGAVVIDHHRPGDPGYGRPPAEFLPASSIGQVISLLARIGGTPTSWLRAGDIPDPCRGALIGPDCQGSWWADEARIPGDLIMVAAADHCLAAAYRGECPGVDPDMLMRWRVASRAAFQQRPEAGLLADVESTRQALLAAPPLSLSPLCERCEGEGEIYHTYSASGQLPYSEQCPECGVADMRRPPYPELPEAAAREGLGYISGPLLAPDGRKKITCAGSPEQVAAFMGSWATSEGLVDIYGDPARGFAGGYLPG